MHEEYIDAGSGPTPANPPPPPLRKIPDALIAAVTHVPRERFLALNRRPEKRTPPPKRVASEPSAGRARRKRRGEMG